MISSRSELSTSFPTQKVAQTEAKEVSVALKVLYILIVRDKSRAICDLLNDPQKLQEEREFARRTRDKFQGISSTGTTESSVPKPVPSGNSSATNAKYGGFGSEDMSSFGYKPGQFN